MWIVCDVGTLQRYARDSSAHIVSSDDMKPVPAENHSTYAEMSDEWMAETFDVGLSAIAHGQLAVIVLAGAEKK